MPKLDGTHLPQRLSARLNALKAGEEVAARDVRALLSDEQVAAMDTAWEVQQELRKKKKAKTKEEEKELGWKSKREIHIEAYEQALKIMEEGELEALKGRMRKNEVRAAKIYLEAYFSAIDEGKESWSAHLEANNELTRAHLNKVQSVRGNTRDKEVWAMEDAIRAEIRKNLTEDELEHISALEKQNLKRLNSKRKASN